MNIKSLLMGTLAAIFLSATGFAFESPDEQATDSYETGIKLKESAVEGSIFKLVKHKGGGKWELPEWIEKAAKKQEERRKMEFPSWDDFDDDDDFYNE